MLDCCRFRRFNLLFHCANCRSFRLWFHFHGHHSILFGCSFSFLIPVVVLSELFSIAFLSAFGLLLLLIVLVDSFLISFLLSFALLTVTRSSWLSLKLQIVTNIQFKIERLCDVTVIIAFEFRFWICNCLEKDDEGADVAHRTNDPFHPLVWVISERRVSCVA